MGWRFAQLIRRWWIKLYHQVEIPKGVFVGSGSRRAIQIWAFCYSFLILFPLERLLDSALEWWTVFGPLRCQTSSVSSTYGKYNGHHPRLCSKGAKCTSIVGMGRLVIESSLHNESSIFDDISQSHKDRQMTMLTRFFSQRIKKYSTWDKGLKAALGIYFELHRVL